MTQSNAGVIVLSFLLLTGCSAQDASSPSATVVPTAAAASTRSIQTDIIEPACKKTPDNEDPNGTPYLVCPGAAGYTLIVRHVDSGRNSIDIVDAQQRAFPLNYQQIVTRHMFSLADKAEWRVTTKNGHQIPIALLVRVQAREGSRKPAKVTRSFIAIAKITPSQACVTDIIPEGAKSPAEVLRIADAAPIKTCAPPQP